MLPSHLKLDNFKGSKKKEYDWLIDLMRGFQTLDIDSIKKLPIPTAIMIGDYFKRQPKEK